jgi:hypothetical protein
VRSSRWRKPERGCCKILPQVKTKRVQGEERRKTHKHHEVTPKPHIKVCLALTIILPHMRLDCSDYDFLF